MTINSFLQVFETMDHNLTTRHTNESDKKDEYILLVHMNGHGKVLNAKVEQVYVNRGMLFIQAEGQK